MGCTLKVISNLIKTISLNTAFYLWMLFVFSVATLLFDVKSAIVEFVFFLLLLIVYQFTRYKKKSKLKKYIDNMNISLDEGDFKTLSDFEIPVSIIDSKGFVKWCNTMFKAMCNKSTVYDLPISDYINVFDINKFEYDNDTKDRVFYNVTFKNRIYHIKGDIIHTSEDEDNDYYTVLYWFDETEHELLKNKYYAEGFVSGVIYIDNFDDVMQGTSNADKPRLIALMDETLESLAQEADGILKKYEKDKFLLYIQQTQFDRMKKNSFSFTESFKNILVGNKVAPTLSIGFGLNGESFAQNDTFAYSALDMALGRGGDQVVIKDNEMYSFFGGKSKEIEKRTRVKARVISQAIKEVIQDSDQIIIMGHRYADVDVLGSALGLYAVIKALGKKAKILLDTYNQTVERFISKHSDKYTDLFITKPYANELVTSDTLIFVVDTQKYSMVEEPALLDVSKNIVVIDHHRKGTDFIQNALITYHEPFASSASELITEILQYIDNVELEKTQAEALYAGIYMDTKNFTFKTSVRTFDAASYLKRRGVDTIDVKKLFQTDLNAFVKKWAIIENAKPYHDKVAIATCTKSDGDMQTIVAQAADELLNITNISSSFVICDMGDRIIISARSFGDINVQFIMEKLGGGGHMTIAGAQLTDTTVQEVTALLKQTIDEYLNIN